MVAAAAEMPPLLKAAVISSRMYGPAEALSPCPRRDGMKKTQPRFAYNGPSASLAALLSIALP